MEAKKSTPQQRYAKDKTKVRQYRLECYTSTEGDIIDRLDEVENRAGYIKRLIRADIAKQGKDLVGEQPKVLVNEQSKFEG